MAQYFCNGLPNEIKGVAGNTFKTIQGFFPGKDFDDSELKKRKLLKREPALFMLGPILLLAAVALLLGCFPGSLIQMVQSIGALAL